MRLALRLLLVLSLAVALFGGEVGESARFVDDVSNDYIEAPTSPVHKFTKMARTELIYQRSGKVGEVSILTLLPSTEPPHSSGPNLLRLISIQRK